ncbi:MAG: transposase [Oscillospiraceae bacterium]|nr:transposase [Oscillospiraceae bacterium]
MTLTKSSPKNSTSLYVTKSVREDGKKRSKVIEKLGASAELGKKLDGRYPIKWAEEYVKKLTRLDKEGRREIIVKYSPYLLINRGEQRLYSGGYLFLQRIYHDLGIDKICKKITDRHKFEFDIDSILSRLIYVRIILPASKIATYELSKKFFEQPNFEVQHIYRALEVIGVETDFIQAELYKRSTKVAVNHRRWEIEECFRIMKHEFKARPVFIKRDERIKAHFMTCFISLLVYRILEKRLGEKYTCPQIVKELHDMSFLEAPREGYIPAYTRTDFTDALHDAFGFRTDYQILTHSYMKNIFRLTKK